MEETRMQPAVKATRIQIQPTDEMLIEHSLSGDLEAFEQIFYRYYQPVYEYACLVCGVKELAEKILIKTFPKFYRNLSRYPFKQKVLHELLQVSTDLILRARQKGELGRRDKAFAGGREFEGLDLIDRSVLVMGQRFGFNIGVISWILRLKPSRILDKLNQIESLNQPVDWPELEWPAIDYRVMLLSRIQRVRSEKKSYILLPMACLTLVFLVGFWWKISRPPDAFLHQSRVPENVSSPDVFEPRELPIQNIQIEREVFFVRGKGFAEDSLIMARGRGKVLAVDYELFKPRTRAGLRISFEPVDLARYGQFKFFVTGDTSLGYPRKCSVVFKKKGIEVSRKFLFPVSERWNQVTVSFKSRANLAADEAVFAFDDETCATQRSGRIYLDHMAFQNSR